MINTNAVRKSMGQAIPTAPAQSAPRMSNGFGGYAPAQSAPRMSNGFGGYAPTPTQQQAIPEASRRANIVQKVMARPQPSGPRPNIVQKVMARPQPSGPARSSYGMERLQEYLQQAQSKGRPKPTRQPQFGDDDWVNPQYNPDRNAGGYTRFDYKQTGSGLERARTYSDGARIFDTYNKLKAGQPGYTHANFARDYLKSEFNTTPAKATDIQKFEAMDMAMRDVQRKNRRPKRKFGIGDALGIASLATGFTGVGLAPKLLGKTAGRAFGFGSGGKWLAGK